MTKGTASEGKGHRRTPGLDIQSPLKRPRLGPRSDDSDHARHLVRVRRTPAVEKARLSLPIYGYEQQIIEAVRHSHVLFVTGATGSGKTTQIPQFLFEEGFGDPRSPQTKGLVTVTQPRRIAAITCARRVAKELCTILGKEVGYHVRHDAKISKSTKVKFCTDGILLREVENDLLLESYSAVVIDEAHERTWNTDMLLAFLSKSVVLRETHDQLSPLKLIIMSATLDPEIVSLFPDAPLVSVPAREFPVTPHFAKKTEFDYVSAAFSKVCKIHRRLPTGDVLVFLTGRSEIEDLCRRLRKEFTVSKESRGVKVFPLYASLPEALQHQVFEDPSDSGEGRKVIVSTNIAETSVTIPGVRYVVDSGRVKRKVFKSNGLIKAFEVGYISQASAAQRAGRAGRTGPGHCYRLFSSAVMEQMAEFDPPEVLQVPTDEIVLRLRALGIKEVHRFPFPTRPSTDAIRKAERLLTILGALTTSDSDFLGVTRVGQYLSRLPLPPRYALLLFRALPYHGALPYAVRIAAILALGSPFSRDAPSAETKRPVFIHSSSELLSQLRAVCAAEHAFVSHGQEGLTALCDEYNLRLKTITEILRVSEQLEQIVSDHRVSEEAEPGILPNLGPRLLSPPSAMQERALLLATLSAFPDQIARRLTGHEARSLGVPAQLQRIAFSAATHSSPVFLDSRSGITLDGSVRFVTYTSLLETKRKVIMENVTIVCSDWIARDASSLCEFSSRAGKPGSVGARYDVKEDAVFVKVSSIYRPMRWSLGEVEIRAEAAECVAVGDSVYWAFAAAFLRGDVAQHLVKFREGLAGGVELLESCRGGRKALELVQSLKSEKVGSRDALVRVWRRNSCYLLREYLQWMNKDLWGAVRNTWPPVVIGELECEPENHGTYVRPSENWSESD